MRGNPPPFCWDCRHGLTCQQTLPPPLSLFIRPLFRCILCIVFHAGGHILGQRTQIWMSPLGLLCIWIFYLQGMSELLAVSGIISKPLNLVSLGHFLVSRVIKESLRDKNSPQDQTNTNTQCTPPPDTGTQHLGGCSEWWRECLRILRKPGTNSCMKSTKGGGWGVGGCFRGGSK